MSLIHRFTHVDSIVAAGRQLPVCFVWGARAIGIRASLFLPYTADLKPQKSCTRNSWWVLWVLPIELFEQNSNSHHCAQLSQMILPVHWNPSPVYPRLQVQLKVLGTLVQVANWLHPPLFSAHSSTSVYHVIVNTHTEVYKCWVNCDNTQVFRLTFFCVMSQTVSSIVNTHCIL